MERSLILRKYSVDVSRRNIIAPKEFLDWAKLDFSDGGQRGIGNAIGNIKRAIHSRMDEIIDRTHVRYCKGWNPRPRTSDRLEVLKALNVKYTSIVSMLTEIRNIYEHQYRIIEKDRVAGYLDIAELWLDHSYEHYSFNKISMRGVKITEFGVGTVEGKFKLIKCKFSGTFNFDYLWDFKREIHEIKSGRLNIIKMSDVDWQDMLKYDAKYFKRIDPANNYECLLTARMLTSVYKRALKHLGVQSIS